MRAPDAFIRELAEVGLSVESPWDLVNTRQPYRPAVPVLLKWLDRAESEVPAHERAKFREGLVRSLTVKEARGVAAPALIREFRRPGVSSGYRWTTGAALEMVADDAVFDEVVEIATDRSTGRDRQMVVLALARMGNPMAVGVLRDLLDDDNVAGHAVMALGRLKAREVRPAIEHMLKHPTPWIRKEAKKALGKLDG